MASERDFELLDEYLGNRLNEKDKRAFEKALDNDASLKKELRLQQHVIGGIRKARTAELKQMLNNIPVSSLPTQGPSLLTQLGVLVVVAGLVGTGLYFYFNQDDKAEVTNAIAKEEIATDKRAEEAIAQDQVKVPEEQNSASKTEEHPKAKEQPLATAPQSTDSESISPAVRDVFDPSEDAKSGDVASSTDGGSKSGTATTPSIIVETQANSKFDFHYQFKDNKLVLYGIFEKNLYEIMEFFSDNKRTMFLFYKDNYYLLNEENEKVRPLTPINDSALLKKLKDYRSGR